MFFAPNPGILAAGVSTGKTYADFVAHITALATGGALSWGGVTANGAFITTADASGGGSLVGSPWNRVDGFRSGSTSTLFNVVRHSLPSEAAFNEQVSSLLTVFVQMEAAANQTAFPSVTRNGLVSTSYSGASVAARRVTRFLAWVGGAPIEMQPSLGLGPTPYDW